MTTRGVPIVVNADTDGIRCAESCRYLEDMVGWHRCALFGALGDDMKRDAECLQAETSLGNAIRFLGIAR